MRFEPLEPPRTFAVGDSTIADVGRLELGVDEQVTFVAEQAEYDVVRKEWGFYAAPSLNDRVPRHGLVPMLVRNEAQKVFLLLVLEEKLDLFAAYAQQERLTVLRRLDADGAC